MEPKPENSQFLNRMTSLNTSFVRFIVKNLEEFPGADLTPTINSYLEHVNKLDNVYSDQNPKTSTAFHKPTEPVRNNRKQPLPPSSELRSFGSDRSRSQGESAPQEMVLDLWENHSGPSNPQQPSNSSSSMNPPPFIKDSRLSLGFDSTMPKSPLVFNVPGSSNMEKPPVEAFKEPPATRSDSSEPSTYSFFGAMAPRPETIPGSTQPGFFSSILMQEPAKPSQPMLNSIFPKASSSIDPQPNSLFFPQPPSPNDVQPATLFPATLFQNNQTPEAANASEQNENEAPPKVEIVEHREEGALFCMKTAVYILKDKKWDKVGVGCVNIMPGEKNKRLVVRAANAIGNVWINVHIAGHFKAFLKGDKAITIRFPDVKAENEMTIVQYLFKGGNKEEYDELAKHLNANILQ